MRVVRPLPLFLGAVVWTAGCAAAREDRSRLHLERDAGEGRVVVVMEENVVGGYVLLDSELDLRAVRFEHDDGRPEHGLLVASPPDDVRSGSTASLLVDADGRRMAFVAAPAVTGRAELGGATGLFYPARLDHLRRIARADTVVVEWIGTEARLTRTFNSENAARFERWLASLPEARPRVPEMAGMPQGPKDTVAAGPVRRVRVAVPAANVRAGPGTSHPVVTVVVTDVVLEVASQRGPWFEISTADVKGFLHRFTLEELEGAAAGPP